MVSTLVSIYFCSPRPGHAIKANYLRFKTVDSEIYFDFLVKYIPCSIISNISLLLEILDNISIVITGCPVDDVIDLRFKAH